MELFTLCLESEREKKVYDILLHSFMHIIKHTTHILWNNIVATIPAIPSVWVELSGKSRSDIISCKIHNVDPRSMEAQKKPSQQPVIIFKSAGESGTGESCAIFCAHHHNVKCMPKNVVSRTSSSLLSSSSYLLQTFIVSYSIHVPSFDYLHVYMFYSENA